ncbi:MAG: G5 domain-containing protein [Actinobacteria bacterium]|nr:G5 domain-containing protein [Actinomycetota bacterium]
MAGLLLETYRVRIVNGHVVERVLLAREVARDAIPGVREVGRTNSVVHGTETGVASWYDAPGTGYTAASPWLPFGTHVTVTDLATGKSVVVVITDRGPYLDRVIDLSAEAFSALAPLSVGLMQVRLTW